MKKRIAVVAIATLMAGCLTNVGTVSAAEPTEITFIICQKTKKVSS